MVGEGRRAGAGRGLVLLALLLPSPFTPRLGYTPFASLSAEPKCLCRAAVLSPISGLFTCWISDGFFEAHSKELVSKAGGGGGNSRRRPLWGSSMESELQFSALAKEGAGGKQ